MNIVIWLGKIQGGGDISSLAPAVNVLSKIYGNINILGVVSPAGLAIEELKSLDKRELKNLDYDVILFCEKNENVLLTNQESSFVSALKEASQLGIDTDKFVLDRTVLVPNFTVEKYQKLRRSKLSILSQICWGGLVYHRFGLPFLSPTINMYASEKDFLNFLQNPIKSVKKNLRLVKKEFNEELKIEYPVYKIGECEWHMNHYNDFNVAKNKWIERSERINWFNVLAIMYTEDVKILEEFDKLPYGKKVCFVPFETDLESGYYIDLKRLSDPVLWRGVNGIANGKVPLFDMWDMLLYGKKTPLI